MSDAHDTFATAVGCMDGRIQDPVAEFARKKWRVKYVDVITEAGLVKHFARQHEAHPHTSHIRETVKIKVVDVSVAKHNSKGIVVNGHQECAGNPVDDEVQKENILEAANVIRELEPSLEVIPVFVVKGKNGEWKVESL